MAHSEEYIQANHSIFNRGMWHSVNTDSGLYTFLVAQTADSISSASFKPIIEAPHADISTIYITMKQNQQMCKALN